MSKAKYLKQVVISLFGAFFGISTAYPAVSVSSVPLDTASAARPFIQLILDENLSMDSELMFTDKTYGYLIWDDSAKKEVSGYLTNVGNWYPYSPLIYVIPNDQCYAGDDSWCPSSSGVWGNVPPTAQFAYARSPAYNKMYYDTTVTYKPWEASYCDCSGTTVYTNIDPTKAPSHPYSWSYSVYDLTQPVLKYGDSGSFVFRPGMTIPAGAYIKTAGVWSTTPTTVATTVSSGTVQTAIPVYLPHFWNKEACTIDGVTCAKAPDGSSLKYYAIKAGNSFPSGRSYTDELQNFANWFSYYRKRKLAVSGYTGRALVQSSGYYVKPWHTGASWENWPIYDSDLTDPSLNLHRVFGIVYDNHSNIGGYLSPIREYIKITGDELTTNASAVRNSCQKNHTIVITDAYGGSNTVTPPAYNQNTYGATTPYQSIYTGSQADLGLGYYTVNPRTDLTAGKVPVINDGSSNPDLNPNLHMNLHALQLGLRGNVWPANSNAFSTPVTWANPNTGTSWLDSIDDLWHATINGRGKMFNADKPADIYTGLMNIFSTISGATGLVGKVAYSDIKGTDSTAYLTYYNKGAWTGEFKAFALNSDGTAGALKWSSASQLDAKAPSSRVIGAVYQPVASTSYIKSSFDAASLANSSFGGVFLPAYANNTAYLTDAINYLRGDRTKELTSFKPRESAMPPIGMNVGATKTYLSNYYVTTADGLLHAFDKTTGAEQWAFMPPFSVADAGASTSLSWTPQLVLDSNITIEKLTDGTVILIASRGPLGAGYFAMDITSETAATGLAVANKFLWSYPNNGSSAADKAALGASLGKALVTVSTTGTNYVMFGSGYNNTDLNGHIISLNAKTGTTNAIMSTNTSTGSGARGIINITGLLDSTGATRYVYAGDNFGALYRFDTNSPATPGVVINTFVRTNGTSPPIYGAPEVFKSGSNTVIAIGTGKIVSAADLTDANNESVYVFIDDFVTTYGSTLRSQLTPFSLVYSGSNVTMNGTSGYSLGTTSKGWYVDLNASEKANSDLSVYNGKLVFTTNMVTAVDCTSASYLYVLDALKGATNSTTTIGYKQSSVAISSISILNGASSTVKVTARRSDGTIVSQDLGAIAAASVLKKVAWKKL